MPFQKLTYSYLIVICLAFTSCSGGGGGGGTAGATRDTALRIIHASLDGTPLSASIGEVLVQTAGYGDITEYQRVEPGEAVTIRLERQNNPGLVVDTVVAELADQTEYTLFIAGESFERGERATLITEPVETPEDGFARIQLLNGVFDSGTLTLSGGGTSSTPTAERTSSGFYPIAANEEGTETSFTVTNRSGGTVATFTTALPNRGELTVVVSGSTELNRVYVRLYSDLD